MKKLHCCSCGAETTTRKFFALGWLKMDLTLKGGARAVHATCALCRKTDFDLLAHAEQVHTGKITCKNWEAA